MRFCTVLSYKGGYRGQALFGPDVAYFGDSYRTRSNFKNAVARQPGKVLNGLNGRQSEIFTEFPLKDSLNFLILFDVSLEM